MATNPWDQFAPAPVPPRASTIRAAADKAEKDEWDQFAPAPAAPRPAAAPERIDPPEGMPWYEKALVGAGAATDRAARGVTGLIAQTGILGNDADQYLAQGKEDAEVYQKNHPGAWATAGEVAGDIAMGAVPVAKGAQVGGRVLSKALATSPRAAAFAPAAADLAANAGWAAATAPENRGTAAAFGAGGAAAGRVVPWAAGRAMRPTTAGPQAQNLIDAGIQPTFGQVLSEKGGAIPRAFARAEESATSVPIFGAPIRRARERAMTDFQRVSREAALPPGADKAAAGSVDQLSDAFGPAYDNVLKGASFRGNANPFDMSQDDLHDIVQGLSQGRALTNTQVERARGSIQTVLDMAEGGIQGPRAAHEVEKRLKALAYKYKGSPDPDTREYGELIGDVANGWKDHWRGMLPADSATALRSVDEQYSKFVPVRRAAATGNLSEPEAYTPKMLLRAVRAGDKTPNKSNFMGGNLPQQELARSADRVLGNRVPDSGTAERLLTGAGVGAAGSLIAGAPNTLLAGTALAIYGTPVVQRYLTGQTGQKVQQWILQKFPQMTQAERDAAMRQIYQAAAQAGRSAATPQ